MPAGGPARAPVRAGEVEAALRRLGVAPSRALGQSFLVDAFVADAEAALVGTRLGEPIVEVGGGLGILTEALLRRGLGPVTVVEKDPRLARHLARTFGSEVTILEGDVLEVGLPECRAVVGNLPFSVGTPVLERLWALRVPRIVALLQREVAERLAAGPGTKTYGRLSIWSALYGSVELFQPVPSRAFYPPPAVEGRVVVHTARPGPLPVASVAALERVLQGLFTQRRKQLGNLLPALLPHASEAEAVAHDAGWPPDWARARPETLPPEAFFRLAERLAATPGAR